MTYENRCLPASASSLFKGPWLIFVPCASDETFGMGGSLLLAKQKGIKTYLTVLTDEVSQQDENDRELVQFRRKEAVEAANILGIDEVFFWNESDRELRITNDLVERMAEQIRMIQPSSIFFPSFMELEAEYRLNALLLWKAIWICKNFTGNLYSYDLKVQVPANYFIDVSEVMKEKVDLMYVYKTKLNGYDYIINIVKRLNKSRSFKLPDAIDYAEGFFSCCLGHESAIKSQFADYLKPYWYKERLCLLPLVSIIVRTKDRPEHLGEALHSVAAQSYPNLELIVVNDGGQNVRDLVNSFEDFVNNIQYIAVLFNKGRAAAANIGLDNSTGNYLIFLDDDDLIDHEHIDFLVTYILKNPEAQIVYTGVRADDKAQGIVFNSPYHKDMLKVHNNFPIHSVLFDRKLLKLGIRFDEDLQVFEDWDFWLQLSEFAEFHHLDRVSATYRAKGESGVGVGDLLGEKNKKFRARLFDKWLTRWNGVEIDNAFSVLEEKRKTIEQKYVDFKNKIDNAFSVLEEKRKTIEQKYVDLKNKYVSLERKYSEDIENLNNEIQSIKRLFEDLQREKEKQKIELDKLTNECHRAETNYQEILNSRSWKVTAPLRCIGTWARKILLFLGV